MSLRIYHHQRKAKLNQRKQQSRPRNHRKIVMRMRTSLKRSNQLLKVSKLLKLNLHSFKNVRRHPNLSQTRMRMKRNLSPLSKSASIKYLRTRQISKRRAKRNRRRDSLKSTLVGLLGRWLKQILRHCSLNVGRSLRWGFWERTTVNPKELLLLSFQHNLLEPKHSLSMRANNSADQLRLKRVPVRLKAQPRTNSIIMQEQVVALLTISPFPT
jgi:hypothetical protein